MKAFRRHAALPLVLIVTVGCVAHQQPRRMTDRFIKRERGPAKREREALRAPSVPPDKLKETAQAMAAARPAARQPVPSLERENAELAAALATLHSTPNATAARNVAGIYLRLGVLDAAYDHYSRAITLDRTDASSYDGRARIWRMWGQPDRGLGDAYHALYYSPRSAAAHNTLGTLLTGLGQREAAKTEFERALALDPNATYAAHNIAFLERRQGLKRSGPSSGARPSSPTSEVHP